MHPERSKSKILIIDDEESNVRLLAMSLRSDGHEIVTALSGEQGLDAFARTSPDLVLTDIKMPGMDGIQVLKQVKELDPNAEVIIITGHGDIENAIEALHFGASDFINKPVRDEGFGRGHQACRRKTIHQTAAPGLYRHAGNSVWSRQPARLRDNPIFWPN